MNAIADETLRDSIRETMETSFHRRASVKKKQLTDGVNLEKLLEDDIFKMGHILLDLHEKFEIPPNYEPLSEFEKFKTPVDIVEYVEDRISIHKNNA